MYSTPYWRKYLAVPLAASRTFRYLGGVFGGKHVGLQVRISNVDARERHVFGSPVHLEWYRVENHVLNWSVPQAPWQPK